MGCKICGMNKELDVCYDCYMTSMNKWFSEDSGKDVLLRLEMRIKELQEDLNRIIDVLNIVMPNTNKLKKKDIEVLF